MILITGISGKLSSLIHEKAMAKGLSPIAGGSRVRQESPGLRRLDFDDPGSLNLRDVTTLVIVSAGYGEDDIVIRRHDNIISAAERQNVRHVVYTSLSGTGDHLGFALAHRWTERRLMQSGLAWTVLRNGLYAELIADLAAPENGIISAPFGHGRISSVARSDLAEAALTVISDPSSHAGTVYELSGVDAWSIGQFADALNVDYAPVTLSEQRERLAALPLLPFQPPMLMSIYSAGANGFLESRNSDLPRLLANPPTPSLERGVRHLAAAR